MPKRKLAMRERITLQQIVHGVDDYGQSIKNEADDIVELTGIPASFEITGGMETFRGRQIQATVVGVFEIRTQPTDITPLMRVKHVNDGNKIYDIHSVRPAEGPMEGGFRSTWIFVKALA